MDVVSEWLQIDAHGVSLCFENLYAPGIEHLLQIKELPNEFLFLSLAHLLNLNLLQCQAICLLDAMRVRN